MSAVRRLSSGVAILVTFVVATVSGSAISIIARLLVAAVALGSLVSIFLVVSTITTMTMTVRRVSIAWAVALSIARRVASVAVASSVRWDVAVTVGRIWIACLASVWANSAVRVVFSLSFKLSSLSCSEDSKSDSEFLEHFWNLKGLSFILQIGQ